MKMVNQRTLVLTLTLLAATLVSPVVAAPPPVTYQGQLKFQSVPYDGPADFYFALYDQETAGTKVCTYEQLAVEVLNGLFTVEMYLDGVDCFNGDPRWLEISVRTPQDSATLDPRQRVSHAPYALYAFDSSGRSSPS